MINTHLFGLTTDEIIHIYIAQGNTSVEMLRPRSKDVWGEENYTQCYTVTTRMTPAINMGSSVSHFKVSFIVDRGMKSQSNCVHQPQLLTRKESESGESNKSSASLLIFF